MIAAALSPLRLTPWVYLGLSLVNVSIDAHQTVCSQMCVVLRLGGMLSWSFATAAQMKELPDDRNVVIQTGCSFSMINVFATAWVLSFVTDTKQSNW